MAGRGGGICKVVGAAGLGAALIWFAMLLVAAREEPSFWLIGTCVAWLCIVGLSA